MARIEQSFPALGKKHKGKIDTVTVFDSVSEFADAVQTIKMPDHSTGNAWNGGEHVDAVTRKCRTGDMARVAASDEFMSKFEALLGYSGSAFQVQNAMTGGAPNIGAYLSGNPMNMRVRRRVETEKAPLNIVVDCVSSAGIDVKTLEKRGAAILALVRVLSATRPVSLYIAATALSSRDMETHTSHGVVMRLDSAPLDLARAAHMLCATGVSRQMAYGFIQTHGGYRDDVGGLYWGYSSEQFQRENGKAYWQRSLGIGEMLYIAAPYLTDDIVTAPEKWLKQMIAEYGKPDEE
jgi:hypothetical protein